MEIVLKMEKVDPMNKEKNKYDILLDEVRVACGKAGFEETDQNEDNDSYECKFVEKKE